MRAWLWGAPGQLGGREAEGNGGPAIIFPKRGAVSCGWGPWIASTRLGIPQQLGGLI